MTPEKFEEQVEEELEAFGVGRGSLTEDDRWLLRTCHYQGLDVRETCEAVLETRSRRSRESQGGHS